jgi:hypothetical protein
MRTPNTTPASPNCPVQWPVSKSPYPSSMLPLLIQTFPKACAGGVGCLNRLGCRQWLCCHEFFLCQWERVKKGLDRGLAKAPAAPMGQMLVVQGDETTPIRLKSAGPLSLASVVRACCSYP